MDSIKCYGRSIETFIQRMMQAYAEYDPTHIEVVWGVLFEVYHLILEDNGTISTKYLIWECNAGAG